MDKRWSTYIQTPEEIDAHRLLRFDDRYKNQYLQAMGLKGKMKVADIGCGAGTLTRKLSDWLSSDSQIIGIDRDDGFLDYGKRKAEVQGYKNIQYVRGDGYALPIEDNSLDGSTSHTVIEHVDHRRFLKEQIRVVKPGGVVSVVSARPEKSIYVTPKESLSSEEEKLHEKVKLAFEQCAYNDLIAAHPIEPAEMPTLMSSLGFMDIRINGIAITTAVGDGRNTLDYRRQILEEDRIARIEPAKKAYAMAPDLFTAKDLKRVIELNDRRSEERLKEIVIGDQDWSFEVIMLLVVSGQVPID